jgi:hypothetical protein
LQTLTGWKQARKMQFIKYLRQRILEKHTLWSPFTQIRSHSSLPIKLVFCWLVWTYFPVPILFWGFP